VYIQDVYFLNIHQYPLVLCPMFILQAACLTGSKSKKIEQKLLHAYSNLRVKRILVNLIHSFLTSWNPFWVFHDEVG
jgi:uncharacterized membrane protein